MIEGSRPEFVASAQNLDGSERVAEDTPDAAPAPLPEPPERRPESRALVVGAAALAVAIVGGGVAAWVLTGGDEKPEPARFASMPDPCSLVPGETLERFVPNSEPPVPSKADSSTTQRYAACEWAEPPGMRKAGTIVSRRLDISVRLHLDGAAGAKSEYDAAWSGARAMAGTTKGAPGDLRAEAPSIVRIGDQAFTHHMTLSGPLGRAGTVTATVLLHNAVITVRYRGTTSAPEPDGILDPGKSRPMDETAARTGAEQVARDITQTLTACADCRPR